MALMVCGECDGQISSTAKRCPHCGADFSRPSIVDEMLKFGGCLLKITLFGLILFWVFVFVAYAIGVYMNAGPSG